MLFFLLFSKNHKSIAINEQNCKHVVWYRYYLQDCYL